MIPSVEGFIVCLGLLALGYGLGSPIIIGLFGSLAFGATAIVTLGSLGGSSPLIYSAFLLILFVAIACRTGLFLSIREALSHCWPAWLVLLLAAYTVTGALLLPRLLSGQTTVFVPIAGVIREMLLAPVSGNVTQTAYFLLGVFAFCAFLLLTLDRPFLTTVRRGFFTFAALNVALGTIDLAGKLTGLGNVLEPIRTANYALLSDEVGGFTRIAGGFSEASAFAASSVACLAFTFSYWRATGSRLALGLGLALLVLLVFSTSSTAYGALALLCLPIGFSILKSSFHAHLKARDAILLFVALAGVTAIGMLYVARPEILRPFTDLIDAMVFKKLTSESGVERAYWNAKGLEAFFDSGGLGIGMGSSRSSSWAISVLAQLGVLGSLMMATLVAILVRGMRGCDQDADPEAFILAQSARAAALGSLLTSSLSGSGADPGLLFFIGLAVIVSCRARAVDQPEPTPYIAAKSVARVSGL